VAATLLGLLPGRYHRDDGTTVALLGRFVSWSECRRFRQACAGYGNILGSSPVALASVPLTLVDVRPIAPISPTDLFSAASSAFGNDVCACKCDRTKQEM
jgi:hypothetical protein